MCTYLFYCILTVHVDSIDLVQGHFVMIFRLYPLMVLNIY